jgi:hypothetical protein
LRLTSSELGSTLTNRGSPECAVEGVVIDEEGFCEAETSNANDNVKLKVQRRRDPQGLKFDGREVCNRHKKSSSCTREGPLRG